MHIDIEYGVLVEMDFFKEKNIMIEVLQVAGGERKCQKVTLWWSRMKLGDGLGQLWFLNSHRLFTILT